MSAVSNCFRKRRGRVKPFWKKKRRSLPKGQAEALRSRFARIEESMKGGAENGR